MLPEFTSEGTLPPADYELTIDGLRSSVLVAGPSDGYPNWDRGWRAQLVDNLEVLVDQLWQVGIDDVFVDVRSSRTRSTRTTSTATSSAISWSWRPGTSSAG